MFYLHCPTKAASYTLSLVSQKSCVFFLNLTSHDLWVQFHSHSLLQKSHMLSGYQSCKNVLYGLPEGEKSPVFGSLWYVVFSKEWSLARHSSCLDIRTRSKAPHFRTNRRLCLRTFSGWKKGCVWSSLGLAGVAGELPHGNADSMNLIDTSDPSPLTGDGIKLASICIS